MFLVFMVGGAMAASFVEDFDSHQASPCSTAWDGECSDTVAGNGAVDSLQMAYVETVTGGSYIHAALITGSGGSFPNSVRYTLPVSPASGDVFEVELRSWALSTEVAAGLRLQTLDSSGAVLGTQTYTVNSESGDSIFNRFLIGLSDPSIVAVRVDVGVLGAGDQLFLSDLKISHGEAAMPTNADECGEDVCGCPPGTTAGECKFSWNPGPPPICYGEVECSPATTGLTPDFAQIYAP